MSFDPLQILTERFREAIARAFPEAANADPLITPSRNPEFGDYQSNAAMGLAKRLGKPPRDVALAIVRVADIRGVAEPLTEKSIAGPGFINITLRREAVADLLTRLDGPELGLKPAVPAETVVVDLCGVNLAKQMHVGHLRSTVIGDAIARVIERLGHNVIRQNHVGDWGLPIAMVTAKLGEEVAAGRVDLESISLDELDRLYREAQQECAADGKGLAAARRWWSHPKAIAELEEQVAAAEEKLACAKQTLVKLQSGDPATVALWQRIADVTMGACLAMCARLHTKITVDDSAGESSYRDELTPMVAELAQRGVTEESDGALVVRNEGMEEPTLVRKRDGGYLYATTDLAAIRRRVQEMGADRVIYCVDARQSLHFRQVFASAVKAGFADKPEKKDGEGGEEEGKGRASLEHAAFGTILGEDGRPFKTRSGENVRLSDLLDEAHNRAAAAVREKNPDLPPDELDRIAETVAIAAIKYADLSGDRTRDYVFNFDRMLAFEGATGPYLLYALVRIRSIFRKGVDRLGAGAIARSMDAPIELGAKEEKDLALLLLRYPNVVRSVGESLEPHRLCQFLYDLAVAFSGFFDRCPVLQEPSEMVRESRLRLCHITDRVLDEGLTLLGIPTLERM